MGPTLVLSAPDGPHVGPMNLAIRGATICYPAGVKILKVLIKLKKKGTHKRLPRQNTPAVLDCLEDSKCVQIKWSKTRISLTPRKFEVNFRWLIVKMILVVTSGCISWVTTLRWISLDLSYDNLIIWKCCTWNSSVQYVDIYISLHHNIQCMPYTVSWG